VISSIDVQSIARYHDLRIFAAQLKPMGDLRLWNALVLHYGYATFFPYRSFARYKFSLKRFESHKQQIVGMLNPLPARLAYRPEALPARRGHPARRDISCRDLLPR
jgi:hypothetical protein